MASLSLKGIEKQYPNGFKAVHNFNLDIADKEFIIFVGPSGCGKSTTLRMIAGLEDISSGTLEIDGRVVNDVEPKDRDIAMVFQNYALYPHMTVYDNMAFALKLRKVPKDEIDKAVREAAKVLGLESMLERKPKALSGGQRQRVAMGRAIVRNPKVFLMDEPLSNLDAKLRMEIRVELKRLHATTDSTFVYVTHDQLEAMTLSSKVCIMEKGILKQYAAPLDMYNKPSCIFVGDFIGNPTMNFIEAKYRKGIITFCGLQARFISNKMLDFEEKDIVLGIRPEYLQINKQGSVQGTIFSTLPSGMETTVKINTNKTIFTSVVFGSVDYAVDEKVSFDFGGDSIILFDKETENNIAMGSLKFER